MTATAHALVAGAIAARFGDPILAPILAFTSHFIMDAVPHWDIGTNWRSRSKSTTGALAIIDTVLGITVAYFLFIGKAPLIPLLLAVFFSLLHDWLETPWYILFDHQKKHEPGKKAGFWENLAFSVYKLENSCHTKAEFPIGALTQLATVAFFLILLR